MTTVSFGFVSQLFAGWDSTSYLQTLYGFSVQARSLSGLSPSQALLSAERNQARDVKLTAAQPEVKRAIATFNKAVDQATSADQLLRDSSFMEVFLTANGLGDQLESLALARKALTSNPDDPKSLVNVLADTRWKSVSATFQFVVKGLSVVKDAKVRLKLTDAYVEVKWRQSLDQQTPGLSNALTFRARASTVTSTLQILSDPVLRDVVTTAIGVPREIAFQSLDAQIKAIDIRLDVKQLQDAKFVEKFVQRYLLAKSAATTTGVATDFTTLASKASGLVI